MHNPVVALPLPLALLLLGALAFAALRYSRWPAYPIYTATTVGRHRRGATTVPYRPRSWDAVTVEAPTTEPVAYDPLDSRWPLAEVERRMASPFSTPIGTIAVRLPLPDVHQELAVQHGWTLPTEDTRELVTVGG